MGSKTSKILPLVVLAGAGIATGGFGLAAGAGAGATGAATAGSAGLAAGTTAIPGSVAALNGAAIGSTVVPTTAASTGFFSALSQNVQNLSLLDKLQLGLGGTNAVVSGVSGYANSSAQKASLALSEKQDELLLARDSLDIAERERDNQRNLSRVLAGITAAGATRGTAPSRALTRAAVTEAGYESRSLSALSSLNAASAAASGEEYSLRRRLAGNRRIGAAAGSLLDFGLSGVDLINRRSTLGTA